MKRTMLTALIVMYAAASAHAQSFTAGDLTPAEARAIAQEGYVFGLPLVYIAVEADVLTNVAKPEGGRAPFNQFDHHRAFPDAANNKIVGMNVDTLYSLAHLDLSAEPIVLSVPSMPDNRWWIMQIIDAWNDVPAAPGSRTVGARAGISPWSGRTSEAPSPAMFKKSASIPASAPSAGEHTPPERLIMRPSIRFRISTS